MSASENALTVRNSMIEHDRSSPRHCSGGRKGEGWVEGLGRGWGEGWWKNWEGLGGGGGGDGAFEICARPLPLPQTSRPVYVLPPRPPHIYKMTA